MALLLVLGFDLGVKGLYLAYIAGALLGVLVVLGTPRVRRGFVGGKPDGKLLAAMLRFALPLGASAAAFIVLTSLSRVVAFYHFGSAVAGHLAVALKFSQILFLVSACFQLAWQELALAGAVDTESNRCDSARTDLFLRAATAAFTVLLPLTALFLAIFPQFLGEEYAATQGLLPMALLATLAQVVATFFEPILARYGRSWQISLTTLAGALLNLLFVFLTLLLGGGVRLLLGAAAFSFLAVALLRVLLLCRAGALSLSPIRMALLALPLAAVMLVYYLCPPLFQAVALGIALLLGMALLLPEILLLLSRLFAHDT